MSNPDLHAADRDALRVLKALWEQAVRENNLDLIQPHLALGFSIVTFTNKEFTDFDTFKTQWNQTRDALLKGGSYSVTLLPDPSNFTADLALCHGDSQNILTTGNGKKYEFGSRFTVLCQKQNGPGGEWKILRAHSSINPFQNPLLLAGFKKKALQFSLAALAVGLLLGHVITFLVFHSH